MNRRHNFVDILIGFLIAAVVIVVVLTVRNEVVAEPTQETVRTGLEVQHALFTTEGDEGEDCVQISVNEFGKLEIVTLELADCLPGITPTPTVGSTLTVTPGRGTPTPGTTPTTGRVTATPGVTPTTGRVTPTPGTTATPGPSPTVIPPGDHDPTVWHEPGVLYHHHGADPFDTTQVHPEIVEWLQTHPWGPHFSRIGNLWESSPIENVGLWPLGKHEGFINLSEVDTGCDPYNPTIYNGNCIRAYLYQIHALGNSAEFMARVHSWKAVLYVCGGIDGSGECGIVAFGGHHDYGERHSSYKKELCELGISDPSGTGGNPPYKANHTIDQPPYIAGAGSGPQYLFWNSQANPVIGYAFDPDVNNIFTTAWNHLPWSVPSKDGQLCSDPEHDYFPCPDGSCRNSHREFQVFTMVAHLEGVPRPFEGYLDVYGNLNHNCTSVGPLCVPFYVSETVPEGDAHINRLVRHGNPNEAPIMRYGEGATLLPPGMYP